MAKPTIEDYFTDPALTCEAVANGFRHAAIYHRAFGHAMVGMRDGKLVRVEAVDIPIAPPKDVRTDP